MHHRQGLILTCTKPTVTPAQPSTRAQLRGTNLTSMASSPMMDQMAPSPLSASLAILDLGDNPHLAWADGVDAIFGSANSSLYTRLFEL